MFSVESIKEKVIEEMIRDPDFRLAMARLIAKDIEEHDLL